MTALLDRAVSVARALPPETQDDLARILLQLLGEDQEGEILTCEDEEAALASRAAAARGDFATEEEVAAVWKKHGL